MLNTDDAERTLPPTERRRREARQRGEVPRSPELTAAAGLLASSLIFWTYAPTWAAALINALKKSLETNSSSFLAPPAVETVTRSVGNAFSAVLLPSCAILLLVGIVANLIQTGWIWNPAALTPRWRIQSVASWERIVGLITTFIRFPLVACVAWLYIVQRRSLILSLSQLEATAMVVQSIRLFGELFIQLSSALLVLSLIDYGIRYWQHEKRLMMTPDERRREQQEEEVDSRLKRRRSAAA